MDRKLYGMVKLEDVAQVILDSMEGGGIPSFAAGCEKTVMGRIQDYTGEVSGKDGKDAERIAEEHAGELLDSICSANHKYFEMGMKAGAGLVLQLLHG